MSGGLKGFLTDLYYETIKLCCTALYCGGDPGGGGGGGDLLQGVLLRSNLN